MQDAVTHWHLQDNDHKGDAFVMGNCPKLLDETCYFLATDFDKASWETDAIAFFNTCHRMNFPTAFERPRSGNGAHVSMSNWIFVFLESREKLNENFTVEYKVYDSKIIVQEKTKTHKKIFDLADL